MHFDGTVILMKFSVKIVCKIWGEKGKKNSQAKCALPCPIDDLKELECVIT
jgi:hypothetical protein